MKKNCFARFAAAALSLAMLAAAVHPRAATAQLWTRVLQIPQS